MLTEERYIQILDYLKRKKTVTVSELVKLLDTSESTIRRDLNSLSSMGKLCKVHGGATAIENQFISEEHNVETKEKLHTDEKKAIAEYAASTIRKDDFVFIDAGTTTEKMIDYISEKDVTFVTNGFIHARKLAEKGYKVFILGGHIKAATQAVVGTESVTSLRKFNFTKAFLGANGISITGAFSTPDFDEAQVKTAAGENSFVTYILADHSKFNQVYPVTFAEFENACIITDSVPDERYFSKCTIKEVLK